MARRTVFSDQQRALSRRDALTLAAALLAPRGPLAAQEQAATGAPAVWLDMDQAALDAAYDNRVYAPNMDDVTAQHAAMNAAARERLGPPSRFTYGALPIEGLDFYAAPVARAPIQVFIHGGTWRFGSAAAGAYVAEPFVRAGAHTVLLDFSPVDEARGGLAELVGQVRRAVGWIFENAARLDADPARIFVSGHSSGGHLAASVLTTDWAGEYGLPADLIRGGLCISGIFDLRPVRLSWRNDYLHLDDDAEAMLSPQRHIDHLTAPLIVAYGTRETPEFQRQSRDFARAVRNAGKPIELLVGEALNHFEMRGTLANPYGLAGNAALRQMGLI